MLKELFTSKIRLRIIRLFLDNLNEEFHIRAITRKVDTEINAVRRELDNLEGIGFLKKASEGNKVNYSVRSDFLALPELLVMFAKEYGLPARLKGEAANLGFVKFMAVHNNLLKKQVVHGKVDVMIVGNVSLVKLQQMVQKEQENMGCEVNYSVVSEEEFDFFKSRSDKFFTDFIARPFFMVVGDEGEFIR
ncbi:MAG: hypothetical protein ABH814_03705 [bacterium]